MLSCILKATAFPQALGVDPSGRLRLFHLYGFDCGCCDFDVEWGGQNLRQQPVVRFLQVQLTKVDAKVFPTVSNPESSQQWIVGDVFELAF